jgi:hypothetical protein
MEQTDTSTGQWNGTCICGHLHSEHKKNVVFNPNWSAGECDVCKICKHFNEGKNGFVRQFEEQDVCLSCAENDTIQVGSIHQVKAMNCRAKPADRVIIDMGEKLKKIIRVRKDPLRSTKEVFDAIDNIDGCTCCGWDNARYMHEPFCSLYKKK